MLTDLTAGKEKLFKKIFIRNKVLVFLWYKFKKDRRGFLIEKISGPFFLRSTVSLN